MTNSPEQKRGRRGFGMFHRRSGWRIIGSVGLAGDIVAGITLAAYAIPGVPGLCRTGGLAAPGRHLRLSARRARLCAARLVAATGGRADVRHLADDCRHRGRDGRGRCAALRPDRQPGGLHRGHTLPDRMAAAAQHAGAADQRQHFGRLQGRRRIDDHHDPAAEPVRRCRRRTQFLRASGGVGRPTRPDSLPCARHWHRCASCCFCWAIAFCRDGRSLLPLSRCRLSRHWRSDFPRWGCRRPERSQPGCRRWRAQRCVCATSRELFRLPPDACCSPISKVFRPRRTFAGKHGYDLDLRQEFLGMGAANLAAAFGHGYPVAGGLSQTAVNDKAGRPHAACACVCLDHAGAVPAVSH